MEQSTVDSTRATPHHMEVFKASAPSRSKSNEFNPLGNGLERTQSYKPQLGTTSQFHSAEYARKDAFCNSLLDRMVEMLSLAHKRAPNLVIRHRADDDGWELATDAAPRSSPERTHAVEVREGKENTLHVHFHGANFQPEQALPSTPSITAITSLLYTAHAEESMQSKARLGATVFSERKGRGELGLRGLRGETILHRECCPCRSCFCH